MSEKLSEAQRKVLLNYALTADGTKYLQRIKGAPDLETQGFLAWRGRQYGTSFYCITDAGRRALQEADHDR